MISPKSIFTLAAIAAFCAAVAKPVGAAPIDYISLGDSYAWGFTSLDAALPSNGDQGYVKPFADWLGTVLGSGRPNVFNLAIPGETSDSFFQPGSPFQFLNTNYTSPSQSQFGRLGDVLAGETALGHTIGYVSISLGGNDLLALLGNPAFLAASPAEQTAFLLAALGHLQGNLSQLLIGLRTALPDARLLVVGYFDVFRGLGAASPLPVPELDQIIGYLNQVIAFSAATAGGTYIDLTGPFSGHEADWSNILHPFPDGTLNIHPTPTGYQVIANQLIAAVPEPASVALLALGAAGGLLVLQRRSRAA
jgi:hypothetical protein